MNDAEKLAARIIIESQMEYARRTAPWSIPRQLRSLFREPKPKTPRKCGLPECEEMTTHNGGYCCAEHCKDHRELIRARR